MIRSFSILCILLGIILTAYLRCSMSDVAGGGTIETTNGRVSGTVQHPTGAPATRTLVRLLPADYDPVKDTAAVSTDTTDSMGRYAFTYVASGDYTIQATHIDNCTRTLVTGICVAEDTVTAPPGTLQAPGAIKAFLPSGINSTTVYVYVPGTTVFTFLNALSDFVIVDSVPAGALPSVSYSSTNDTVSTVIRYNLHVTPGDTAVILNPSWHYAQRLFLNTAASGADVSGDVYNFPVLVRLTSSTFTFAQAKTGGADLRFAKQNNTSLPYQIERWDVTNSLAEVWVKLDTVYGDNDSQSIIMYWGNPAASGESNSAAVFDTADGFQGVWHLSEAGNTTAFDATANGYDGTPSGMSTASCVPGIIGSAQEFDGSSSMITMANTSGSRLNFPQNGNYSLSAWAYVDTLDGNWHEIAGKGHEQYYIKFKSIGNGRAIWEFVEFQDQLGWEYTEDSVPPSPSIQQWVHVTGVREGSQQRLYINGSLVSSTILLKPGSYSRNTSDDFMMGRYAREVTIPLYEGWCYFDGKIDEVRVSSNVPSANRIKLSYMNQRANDRLVVFR